MGVVAPIFAGAGLMATGLAIGSSMGGRRSSSSSFSSRPQAIPQPGMSQSETLSAKFIQDSQKEQQEALALNSSQNRSYVDNPELKRATARSMLNKLNGVRNE